MITFSGFQMASKRSSQMTKRIRNWLFQLWVTEAIGEETDRKTTSESLSEISPFKPRDSRELLVRARSSEHGIVGTKMREVSIRMYLILVRN